MQREHGILIQLEEAIASSIDFVEHMNYSEFLVDRRTQKALRCNLQVIGDAAKDIAVDIRHSREDIPWSQMAKMRDKPVHDYGDIDLKRVWDTVKLDLPGLLPKVRKLLEDYPDE